MEEALTLRLISPSRRKICIRRRMKTASNLYSCAGLLPAFTFRENPNWWLRQSANQRASNVIRLLTMWRAPRYLSVSRMEPLMPSIWSHLNRTKKRCRNVTSSWLLQCCVSKPKQLTVTFRVLHAYITNPGVPYIFLQLFASAAKLS